MDMKTSPWRLAFLPALAVVAACSSERPDFTNDSAEGSRSSDVDETDPQVGESDTDGGTGVVSPVGSSELGEVAATDGDGAESASIGDACGSPQCLADTECRSYVASDASNCTAVGQCAATASCSNQGTAAGTPCQNGEGTCDGAGQCVVPDELTHGQTRTSNEECGSDSCATTASGTSVCCNEACDGVCETCAVERRAAPGSSAPPGHVTAKSATTTARAAMPPAAERTTKTSTTAAPRARIAINPTPNLRASTTPAPIPALRAS